MNAVLRIAPDHPAFAGHFPGNPILPGAWLLAEVVREITAAAGAAAPCSIKSAKFFRPVRPGDSVEIEYTQSLQEVRFQCTVAGAKVMAGVVTGASDAAAGE
jgi:3-hydroxyacyl-[acyl-carrier-protein] dehydratase